MTVGSFDTENCGPIIGWADIVDDAGYWTIQIDSVSFANEQAIFSPPLFGISDTGSSAIYGPREIVEEIYAKIGVHPSPFGPIIPCDREYDPIVFEIAGQEYAVTKEMLTVKSGHSCQFAMLASDDKTWFLGYPFIRQYCHVYDMANKRIGFAEIKKN